MNKTTSALFWYKNESEYLKMRGIVSDRDQIACEYSKWVDSANNLVNSLNARGIHVVKVECCAEEFSAWCKINRKTPNQSARQIFAVEKISKLVDGTEMG